MHHDRLLGGPVREPVHTLAPGGGGARKDSALLELVGRQLMAGEELVEVRAVALGEPGRLRDVPARDLQDLREVTAGELVPGLIEGRQVSLRAPEGLLDQLDRDDRSLGERHVLAHHVLQLADVPGPVGRRQQFDRFRRIDLALAGLGGDLGEEVRDQQRDVLAAAIERGHLDVHHVQPVIQVLAELALGEQLLQVAVGGGDDPHVHRQCLRAAYGADQPLLQHAQQLDLEPKRHVADLIEHERAAVGGHE